MITIATKPNESSSIVLRVFFKDVDGSSFTPLTCVWSLTDESGNVINSRDRVSVSVGSEGYYDFVISGNDIKYSDGDTRVFLVEGTYDSIFGDGLPFREEAKFMIQDTIRNAL